MCNVCLLLVIPLVTFVTWSTVLPVFQLFLQVWFEKSRYSRWNNLDWITWSVKLYLDSSWKGSIVLFSIRQWEMLLKIHIFKSYLVSTSKVIDLFSNSILHRLYERFLLCHSLPTLVIYITCSTALDLRSWGAVSVQLQRGIDRFGVG